MVQRFMTDAQLGDTRPNNLEQFGVEAFVAIAARICPNDVRLTLEQAIPGGMSLEDYSLLRSDCGDQGRLARCRPITARCGIPTCAGGVARLSEEPADRCVDYR